MGFSTLLDIDKLTLMMMIVVQAMVLVLCWILINLHRKDYRNDCRSFSTLLDIDKLTPREISI